MKVFFKKILVYVLLCGITVHLLTLLSGRYLNTYYRPNLHIPLKDYGFTYSRLKEVKSKNKIDVLVLGNSHAYRGYDPRIFKKSGFELFNLGSSSQTPYQSRYLLEEYINALDPCVVIIETNPLYFALDGQESAFDILANEAYNFRLMKMTSKVNCYPSYLAHHFAFMNSILPADTISEPRVIWNDAYVNGGFVEKIDPLEFNNQFPFDAYSLIEEQVEEFLAMTSFLRKIGQDYRVVYAPVTIRFYEEYVNRIDMKRVLEANGEKVLDFNQYTELTDQDHFYDLHHLNQKGVIAFNERLIEELQLNCN